MHFLSTKLIVCFFEFSVTVLKTNQTTQSNLVIE